MKIWEKQELTRLVIKAINDQQSMADTVRKINKLGFKKPTIRDYYKIFYK